QLIAIVHHKPPDAGLYEWVLDEADMLHGPFVPPEVDPAQIAERQPDARMHRGVVGRVLSLHGRQIASDLETARRADVGEVGPQDGRVLIDVRRERSAVHANLEPRVLAYKLQFGSRGRIDDETDDEADSERPHPTLIACTHRAFPLRR